MAIFFIQFADSPAPSFSSYRSLSPPWSPSLSVSPIRVAPKPEWSMCALGIFARVCVHARACVRAYCECIESTLNTVRVHLAVLSSVVLCTSNRATRAQHTIFTTSKFSYGQRTVYGFCRRDNNRVVKQRSIDRFSMIWNYTCNYRNYFQCMEIVAVCVFSFFFWNSTGFIDLSVLRRLVNDFAFVLWLLWANA